MSETEKLCGLCVADIMSGNVICVDEDDSVPFVIKIFDRCHISGAPVLNHKGEYAGVLSKTDLFAKALLQHLKQYGNLEDLKVKDIMNNNPLITVYEDLSVEKAAELMLNHHIHRVFVKNKIGRISGVVSSYDILKVVAVDDKTRKKIPLEEITIISEKKDDRIEQLRGQFRKEHYKTQRVT